MSTIDWSNTMTLLTSLRELDWTRGIQFWILVAASFSASESIVLFWRAAVVRRKGGDDNVQ
ncbi:hypothetical protein [Caballeronia sordidicola]|jgi:hypothetical protein|uniref:hypothetical protein n=1 Tax=Caballeronia sordidicola TaxID=196367 RepID=UPI001177CF98|nr:hypothetical protein [Caballeronia sordidicola]